VLQEALINTLQPCRQQEPSECKVFGGCLTANMFCASGITAALLIMCLRRAVVRGIGSSSRVCALFKLTQKAVLAHAQAMYHPKA
jgi:hypothetical protein